MGTSAADIEVVDDGNDETKTATGTLTIEAPEGAEFEMEEVKTGKGLRSLGQVPILVWAQLPRAIEYYGDEGVRDVLDGTSLRVSFQNIARRFASAGKTMDEIAQAQINFRPGKRVAGVSTPVSRAGNAARKAAEKLGDKADDVTAFLEKISRGEISEEQLKALGFGG